MDYAFFPWMDFEWKIQLIYFLFFNDPTGNISQSQFVENPHFGIFTSFSTFYTVALTVQVLNVTFVRMAQVLRKP